MKKFRYASLPFAVYALIFILAPLILIVFYSFAGPNGGLTLEHYKAFFNFEDPVYLQVLWRSIKVAAVSTLICLALCAAHVDEFPASYLRLDDPAGAHWPD